MKSHNQAMKFPTVAGRSFFAPFMAGARVLKEILRDSGKDQTQKVRVQVDC